MSKSDAWRVTFSRRFQDVNFEHVIFSVIFSVLVHQMCLLDTNKVVIAYPRKVLKKSLSVSLSVVSLVRPQDVNLIVIQKVGF